MSFNFDDKRKRPGAGSEPPAQKMYWAAIGTLIAAGIWWIARGYEILENILIP